MSVALSEGKQATDEDISSLESEIGLPLNEAFKSFIKSHHGARVEYNSFPVNGIHMGGIDGFLTANEIISIRRMIGDFPRHAYPIASSAGGNYVLLDQGQGGAIFFWDHEIEGGIYRIADDLDGFLALMEPFDVSSVDIDPDKVRSAWIDPDLLKEYGE